MDRTAQAYDQLIGRFVRWAQSEENIRAAVVIGSRARTDHPADEWADLDIVILARNIDPYLKEAHWIERFGHPSITFLEPTAGGPGMERRVLYEGGLDVDFAFFPLAAIQKAFQETLPPEWNQAFGRGFRILLDKEGLMELLKPALSAPAPPHLPTQEQILNSINDFWYHAVWSAKHLRRGELWWAKSGSDGHLKNLLKQMLEWHARALKGPGHDTWLRGRFLEEWADPRAVKELRSCFAHYESEDIWEALLATMELFSRVAREMAEKSGYTYPSSGDECATELVRKLYEGRR